MTNRFAAPFGAASILLLTAGSAFAGAAVVATDMTVREGPGDTFRPILTLVAGMRVDVRECDIHQWCLVEHEGKRGWVHVQLSGPSSQVDASSDTADASSPDGSSTIGGKGGTDGGSSKTTKRERLSTDGSNPDSGPGAYAPTEIALSKPSRF